MESRGDLVRQEQAILIGEFFSISKTLYRGIFSMTKKLYRGIKSRIAKSSMQRITAICCAPGQEKKVRPTKVILTLFLLASAITGLLPARPVVRLFNAIQRIRARRFGARRTAGDCGK
jgi:hypothetical protein